MQSEDLKAAFESVGERWVDTVCPVFVDSNKSFVTAAGLGTSFIASVRDDLFLITAHHVIEDSKKYSVRVINLQGKAYDTGGLEFFGDSKNDIVYSPLQKAELNKLGLLGVKHYPLARGWHGWMPTETFSLLGYPGTKNELKLRFGKTDRHCFNLLATTLKNGQCDTEVEDPILLGYSPKKAVDIKGTKINPPDLFGMSGGPCFQIMVKETDQGLSIAPRLVGVSVEWHQDRNIVVVSPIKHIFDSDG
ncbi:hypothetical protein [Stenotrophomonas ginsengisoli]|uniref:hypothetical protein n=1 Tax=Stenotrophomonas ginsengisoli TaxID=336566 RepID=UPI000B252AD8|nr:hypothetical protein [Stenotrophomonas ginsengisoli]